MPPAKRRGGKAADADVANELLREAGWDVIGWLMRCRPATCRRWQDCSAVYWKRLAAAAAARRDRQIAAEAALLLRKHERRAGEERRQCGG